MRALALILSVAWAVGILAGCSRYGDAASRNVVPREITMALENSTQFVLLSVDPLPVDFPHPSLEPPKDVFHGHAILGQTEIRDKAQRISLLRALYKGIGDSGFGKSDMLNGRTCFNPRHGIRATNGTGTVDLLICFECFWIRSYTRDGEKTLTTTDSPQKSFDGALEAAHVPLPMPEGPNQTMQPTARRRTVSLSMIKELSFQTSLAVTSGG